MVRKILLGGIILVSVVIVIVAFQRQRARDHGAADNETRSTPPPPQFKIIKYDKENNPVAEVTGLQAVQASEKGPIEIVKPKITILKDKRTTTVITADTGHVEGREQDKMDEGWLKGNVVMTVVDKDTGDNTVLTCDEMMYHGAQEQVFIPGLMTLRNRSMEVTGSQLTVGAGLASAKLEKDVKLVLKDAAQDALQKLTQEEKPGPSVVAPSTPPVQLEITSGGMLTFQRDANRATFEKQVVATQGKNSVSGDSMVVEFEKTSRETTANTSSGGSAMNVRRVVVRSDRKEGVVLDSPTRQAWGDRMEFDGGTGLLVFGGSPCRIVQKSGAETYQLEGREVRFGRQGVLGQTEQLPEGMDAHSQKMLIAGDPARAVSISADPRQSSVLTGKRVLFDQDTRVVHLAGDEKQPATAEQEKNRITGVEIEFFQKTGTRGEKVLGRGPGRLEMGDRRQATSKGPAQPAVVSFGETMTYLPESLRAEFTGGVRLVDGATTSLSKTLSIELAEGKEPGSREMKRMVASGNVAVTGDKRSASGETLTYSYPTPGSDLFVATLTAKPGETCEIKSGDLLCRSGVVEMVETPVGGGKTSLRAKGTGRGCILYQPAAAPPGTKPTGEPFEVRYDQSGTFDDAALEAIFDGNVRVRRPDMNLAARHVVMNFVKGKPEAKGEAEPTEQLDLASLTAVDDVTLTSGPSDDLTTATGRKLVWRRKEGTTELQGGDREKDFARVVRDKSSLEAPVMQVVLRNDEVDRVITKGGGRLKGQTRARQGSTDAKKFQDLEVTWSGEGVYQTFHPSDQQSEPTAEAQVRGSVKAVGEDADVTSETLTVCFGPEREAQDPENLKLEVRKVQAMGNAHAKMFMPEGNYYRYARGDSLEWDRLADRMVVMSETSDAVVWDNSNEWRGKQLVVNQTKEGRVEAESTSGRRIIFYEEGTPQVPSEDARDWKPIY